MLQVALLCKRIIGAATTGGRRHALETATLMPGNYSLSSAVGTLRTGSPEGAVIEGTRKQRL